MQFALLIYHSPEEFAIRKNDYNDPHLGAWRTGTRVRRSVRSANGAVQTFKPRTVDRGGNWPRR